LKSKALVGAGKRAEATTILESLLEHDSTGETAAMLLEQYQEGGQNDKAAALAEKLFQADPRTYSQAHQVATFLIEARDFGRARVLLGTIRDAMIESGEYETLAQSFNRLIELQPGQIEPLEWLVDLYGRASDSFRLPDALAQLARAQESAGETAKALETYEKLIERSPEDETTRRSYMRLRAKAGLDSAPAEIPPPVKVTAQEEEDKPLPPAFSEPALEEETERYVTQALTDVDLFSSYGLTQKAIDLLETVLERAPQHVPILERLFDLSLGAGNTERTVEIAAMLEHIAINRKDRAAFEKYAEFRRRFEGSDKPASAGAAPDARPSTPAVQEFAVPTIEAELVEPVEEIPAEPPAIEKTVVPATVEPAIHEVDLSDEWEALSEQVEIVEPGTHEVPADPAPLIPVEPMTFDLELQPDTSAEVLQDEGLSADALMAELAAELEMVTDSLGIPAAFAQPSGHAAGQPPSASAASSASPQAPANPASTPAPIVADEFKGPLCDLFEEFRSELGESRKDDEDLETHYNLGVAYREMGLLEEAIGEFQKVAKGAEKEPAFRYAMQCCTLLGLAFMEKGQPAIAAIWYERALLTAGLDQESILALRYDLGVAQELAGDTEAAAHSFSQVYAMNIDYRDISERVALLGKPR
jgi:tetratricopeptide (TPR) repeat protein